VPKETISGKEAELNSAFKTNNIPVPKKLIPLLSSIDCEIIFTTCAYKDSLYNISMIKFLCLFSITDPSFHNNITVYEAAKHKSTGVIKILLKDGRVNPVDQKNSALKAATDSVQQTQDNDPKTLDLLLSHEAAGKEFINGDNTYTENFFNLEHALSYYPFYSKTPPKNKVNTPPLPQQTADTSLLKPTQ
jgi:hypothetical protein